METASPARRAPRVATLLPSATEIVCALGLEDALVGVSHECDWPPSVRSRPVLTSTRVGKGLPSRAIDHDVRQILRGALAVYDVDVDALARAAPDVIVTQDLCDVCAVSLADVERAAEALACKATIVSLHPTRLEDVLADVVRVGAALGRPRQAEAVVAGIRERIERVRQRAATITSRPDALTPSGLTPNVLTIEWLDPVMVGGTWMPELVELAGGRALVARPGDRAPTLSLEQLGRLAPDVVLFKPCGFELERTLAEAELLRQILGASAAPTRGRGPAREGGPARGRRAFVADGNAYFNRPGPRIADSLEILAACVHPEEFADLAARHQRAFCPFELG